MNSSIALYLFNIYYAICGSQILADGLRTGETEWLEPLETRSAVELTKELIQGRPGSPD